MGEYDHTQAYYYFSVIELLRWTKHCPDRESVWEGVAGRGFGADRREPCHRVVHGETVALSPRMPLL